MLLETIKLGQILSKKEMREVKGGGSCQAQGSGLSEPVTNITREQAISISNAFGGHWCCASCYKASWARK